MTDSASLTMLKKAGAKAQAVDEELAKPAAAAPVEATNVDVDDMNSEQLDALVKSEGVETPAEWTTWDADGKRNWLKSQFGDSEEVATVQASIQAAVDKSEPDKVTAEPTPKAKKSKKTKGTDVATSDVKTGEVVEADVLQDLVHEIENLKETAAYGMIDDLIEQTDVTYFKLGGVLSVCMSNQWFQGYPSFKEMLEGKYGFAYRKGMYLVEIYNKLSNSGIPWAKVSSLGWTKLQIIARVLTLENVDQWVQIANEQNALTLIETVKNAIAKKPDQLTDESKTVTTMSFKVHSDQKATIDAAIEKAKEASSTSVGTVALEFVCLDYMGGQTLDQRLAAAGPVATGKIIAKVFAGNPESLAALMKELDIEAALNAIGTAAPYLNITVAPVDDEANEAA